MTFRTLRKSRQVGRLIDGNVNSIINKACSTTDSTCSLKYRKVQYYNASIQNISVMKFLQECAAWRYQRYDTIRYFIQRGVFA